jgi:hypothetical protein
VQDKDLAGSLRNFRENDKGCEPVFRTTEYGDAGLTEPFRQIEKVCLCIGSGLRVIPYAASDRFADERWASLGGIQIEIKKVMETGVDNRAPMLSVRLERKCQVECALLENASARCNNATRLGAEGNRICAFMWVRRK